MAKWKNAITVDDGRVCGNAVTLVESLAESIVASPADLKYSRIGYDLMDSSPALKGQFFWLLLRLKGRQVDDLPLLDMALNSLGRSKSTLDGAVLADFLDDVIAMAERDLDAAPINPAIGLVQRTLKLESPDPQTKRRLERLHELIAAGKPSAARKRHLKQLAALQDSGIAGRLKPDEGWADDVVALLAGADRELAPKWEALLSHCAAIRPADRNEWAVEWDIRMRPEEHLELTLDLAPSDAWRKQARELVEAVGAGRFHQQLVRLLDRVPKSKPGQLARDSVNREMMRGLLYCGAQIDEPDVATATGLAAAHLCRKKSQLAAAAVRCLAMMNHEAAGQALATLSNRAATDVLRSLAGLALQRLADRQGVSLDAMAELSVSDSGLTEVGSRVEDFDGYRAELTANGPQSVRIQWYRPDGRPQKSIPAKVKREHGDRVRHLKLAQKELSATLSIVRKRLEDAWLADRSWPWEQWLERYHQHHAAAVLSRRLIWSFHAGNETVSAAWHEGQWRGADGAKRAPDKHCTVRLWHPIEASADEVQRWRRRLETWERTQPFKQAHREVYRLTDAERETGVYSNRFAAHIMRQSHFRSLAKARGWTADYLGGWDGGTSGVACREASERGLKAEFWTQAIEGEHNDAGGFTFLSSDQVRFYPRPAREPMPLAEVDPLVFSELMRDVDLFVGVCSIANDPNWSDSGVDRFRDYWLETSFGDLSATAETRREILERLVPKLRIASQCEFEPRFLVVHGKRRTYKIHYGSGNILMSPNDEYLCIVPESRDEPPALLPFEGDDRLSIILSKALLLADESQITDPTILTQIG